MVKIKQVLVARVGDKTGETVDLYKSKSHSLEDLRNILKKKDLIEKKQVYKVIDNDTEILIWRKPDRINPAKPLNIVLYERYSKVTLK